MTTLQEAIAAVDVLSPDELETLYQHVVIRRHHRYWLVPGSALNQIQQIMRPVYAATAHMTETEINAAIDEALAEVRRGQNADPDRRD